ncbi:MAG TPA: hypothetical protein VMP01_06115 [Pirellulaceae bacterium]|nr:hypothetical protein [Pirellulaceae bacterium]
MPLYILSEMGVIEPGCGYRPMGHEKPGSGPILIIDDSRGTGRSQQRAMPIAGKHWHRRKLFYAALYRNMLAVKHGSFGDLLAAIPELASVQPFTSANILSPQDRAQRCLSGEIAAHSVDTAAWRSGC